MTEAATSQAPPSQGLESLALLHQLTIDVGRSQNLDQLTFRMLNRTVALCPYDRAMLWVFRDGRPQFAGISGNQKADQQSPLIADCRGLVERLPERTAPMIVSEQTYASDSKAWQDMSRRMNTLSVVWLPLVVDEHVQAGLWLERWNGRCFQQREMPLIEAIGATYSMLWQKVYRPAGRWRTWIRTRPGMAAVAALIITLLVLAIPVPARIVAPCEIVPRDPVVVAAPVEGVIDEVRVLPGREIQAGDVLATYDMRVAVEELNVARQQVEMIASELKRYRVQALQDATARAQVQLLENRLKQEQIKLEHLQSQIEKMQIKASTSGTLMLEDPHMWRGRPVQVGERMMMIVDPAQTKVRIWLPVDDNIDFDPDREVNVILDSDPRTSRKAQLRFVANHSQVNETGQLGFRAEAYWSNPQEAVKTGGHGAAILFGESVPLGYWMMRRPIAALRTWVGM